MIRFAGVLIAIEQAYYLFKLVRRRNSADFICKLDTIHGKRIHHISSSLKKMRILLFGLIFFSFSLCGQNTFFHDKYGYYESQHYGYGVAAGIFQADFKNLNNHIRAMGAKEDFGSSYYAGGVIAFIPMGGRYGESDATICIEPFLPKTIRVGDSLQFIFRGFHIATSGWGKDLLHSDKFDLVISTGIDWGMAYYKERSSEIPIAYHNFFISPLARVEFHYIIKHLDVGMRATYRYDATAHHWKNNIDNSPAYNGNGFSGLGVELTLSKVHIEADLHNTENQFAPPVEQH